MGTKSKGTNSGSFGAKRWTSVKDSTGRVHVVEAGMSEAAIKYSVKKHARLMEEYKQKRIAQSRKRRDENKEDTKKDS